MRSIITLVFSLLVCPALSKDIQLQNLGNITDLVFGCSTHTDCSTCADSGCNWCELDGGSCHAPGSVVNPCHFFEGITDSKYCGCVPSTCKPQNGEPSSVCSWYETVTNSKDPNEWAGGNFLPANYISAAVCACSGCGVGGCNRLWEMNPPAASCVRGSLVRQHKALNATFRQFVKDTPYINNYKYVEVFYDMHVKAYKDCCCAGVPAPYVTWLGIFYAGGVLPCNTFPVGEISSILEFGRCGCGW